MRTELPFEVTPQIKRHLEELTFPTEFDSGEGKNIVEVFAVGERVSESSFANIEKFLVFIQKEGLVKFDELPKIVKTNDGKGVRPKTLKVMVLDEQGLQDLANYINEKQNTKLKSPGLYWDPWTRTLRHDNIQLTFHDKRSPRILLFKYLLKKQGKPIEARFLAAQFGLTQDTRLDRYNDSGIEKVCKIAKDLGKYLKKKGFPITIKTRGGILMTVKERVKRAKTFAP